MPRSVFITAIFAIALTGCGGGDANRETPVAQEATGTILVYTVNYPLATFADRIGGDLVDVVFPAPADADPAFWSPDGDTIAAYQDADLILLNGAGYAKWVDRATLPASKIVDTSETFSNRLIPLAGMATHSHGPEGEHEHGGWAFTTWLDPMLAIEQARAAADALATLRPEYEGEIRARFGLLEKDLVDLDARFTAAAAGIGDAPLVFSHPVYQYLIRRYELNAAEVHWEPDEVPDIHAWDHFEELLASRPAKWMLWEGEPLAETAAGLGELGLDTVVFDPCGNLPEDGDYWTVMADNVEAFEAVAR